MNRTLPHVSPVLAREKAVRRECVRHYRHITALIEASLRGRGVAALDEADAYLTRLKAVSGDVHRRVLRLVAARFVKRD